uniref:Uncharacterized protein n=1 Tax=Meloidogyne incognita TaxID=6306 RepID=A0A914NFW7_MELIC
MVIREQLKTLKEFNFKNNKKELYGRLLSPMFNLKPSETFCVSVQTKLERGGFGAIFRVGIRFESEPQSLWLYRKSLQRFWPQGEWLRLSWQLRRKSVNRGFQLIFDVSKHNEADQIKFFFSLDNLFVRASDCPIELEPFFGAAPDEETEANLLIPVENLIDTDPRVFRTAGLDGLPAVGIKVVEIICTIKKKLILIRC